MASESDGEERGRRVCVTGAGGYVASWLVKLLLSKGYVVHGTVRDPAITGCTGVFHVACPVPSTSLPNPEVELLGPAVTGTLNVLKACSEARVKRVVVVSSVAAVALNPNWPKDQVMDEACWSDKDYCKATSNWYCLAKTAAETEAFEYAKENGLNIVTVCPNLVLGPMLQSTMNASSEVLVKILKEGIDTMENKVRKIVDVRDVAEALLLTYEEPEARGRFICLSYNIRASDLVEMLRRLYPNYSYPKSFTGGGAGELVSSEKLQKLGWKYRPLEETLVDSVQSYQEIGLLSKN